MKNRNALVILLLPVFTLLACAQDASKRPAPRPAQCKFSDGKYRQVGLLQSRMKGRKIFGGLVALRRSLAGRSQRCTTLVTDTNLNVGGKDVPAGATRSLLCLTPTSWVLIISKKTGEWGIPYPAREKTLLGWI